MNEFKGDATGYNLDNSAPIENETERGTSSTPTLESECIQMGKTATATAVQTAAPEAPEAMEDFFSVKLVVIGSGEVDPSDLVIDEEANGRRYPTDVSGMAKSLLSKGQEQPIVVRKQDGKLHVVFGYRRARGGLYIQEHRLAEDFKLRYELVDMTQAQAFIHNLVENKERQDVSVIEHAHNYLRLTEAPYNMSQTAVAEELDISSGLVSRRLSLVRGNKEYPALSAKLQKLVHSGKIAAESAYNLVAMPEAEREKFAAQLVAGEANSSDARQKSKPKKKTAKGDAAVKEGKALTAKAIRLPFEEVVTKHARVVEKAPDTETPVYVQLCDLFTRMCTGQIKAQSALRKIRELVGE